MSEIQTHIDRLDNKSILVILSAITGDLRDNLHSSVTDTETAFLLLASFLEQGGVNPTVVNRIKSTTPEDIQISGKRLLGILASDDRTSRETRELINDPPESPEDVQLDVMLATSGAIILGALITWLQTKFSVKLSREQNATSFEFSLEKGSLDDKTMSQVASEVSSLISV